MSLKNLQDNADESSSINWLNTRITTKTNLSPIKPSITINGTWMCTTGELMQVSGQKKVGKSNVLKFIVATALMKEVNISQTLGIRANFTEKDIVFVDTEHSKQSTQAILKRVLQIAELEKEPKNLYFYNIRSFDINGRMSFLTDYLFKKHKDSSLILIDGITDFIDSVNNEDYSKKIVDFLIKQLGGELSIVVTIHENKDGKGSRGHIGQEIERKCVGSISVYKDRDKKVHRITCKLNRNDDDFEDIFFRYNSEIKDFIMVDSKDGFKSPIDKSGDKEIKEFFQQIFMGVDEMDKRRILEYLLDSVFVNKSAKKDSQYKQAKRKFDQTLELGVIKVSRLNYYKLCD